MSQISKTVLMWSLELLEEGSKEQDRRAIYSS